MRLSEILDTMILYMLVAAVIFIIRTLGDIKAYLGHLERRIDNLETRRR